MIRALLLSSLFGLACMTCSATAQTKEIAINHKEASLIGKKIFQNECAGKASCLTSWNRGEAFPSLGIGHFIWYPENSRGPFKESFPELVKFMRARNIQMPAWLKKAIKTGAPWSSRNLFLTAQKSQRMQQLRGLLSSTKGVQTAFMIKRLNHALPRILASIPTAEHEYIRQIFNQIAAAPMGYYALVDYVNFKGEGVKLSERYQGIGWGLLQVLEEMGRRNDHDNALISFSESAKRVLTRRVMLSPPERNEQRWLNGWKKRVSTYMPGVFTDL